jgi:negative regulator of flagellin synthesis FlgM
MSISQLNGQERLRATMALAALRNNSIGTVASPGAIARQPDTVSISDAARSIAAAHKTAASSADVREDRIAALKAAIADGTYAVDSKSLARKLVSDFAQ